MRTRLFVSFAMVAGTGALTFYIAARFAVPTLFDQRMGNGGMGQGNGATAGNGAAAGNAASAGQHDALVSAVNSAMLIALVATLVCSTLIAVVMSRRTLRSVNDLRLGAAQLASGNYATRVSRPNEAELGGLADDINHLATTLADTEQRRAALVGDVAHEMRTPLTTISGTLEGFDDGLFTQAELTDTVRTEVGRLHRLAGDLAAVSRAEEGQLHLDRQRGDLAELVTDTTARLRPRFDQADVQLTVDVSGPLLADFDRDRMVQVLTNLLTNALAYSTPPGIVTVRAAASGSTASISVADNGRGLHAGELEHVFERFYRAERNDHSGGTGIGLTISRAIARAHGGELVAASAGPGRGATFTVTLPLV
ncbi:MAG: HAMP domain-containing protein [Actinobacteria bacterium]|nr:HAMP domain-containing protein [Actinomycetota bacterium]